MESTLVPTSGVPAPGVSKNATAKKGAKGSGNNKPNQRMNINNNGPNSNKSNTQQGVKPMNATSSSGKLKPKPPKHQPAGSKSELSTTDDKESVMSEAYQRPEMFPIDKVYTPLGIINQQRFCSFNALIQALMVTPKIYELLQRCKGADHPTCQALWTLHTKFWTSEALSCRQREQRVINPFDLPDVRSFMFNEQFSTRDIDDPAEYYNFLVNSLDQESSENVSGVASPDQGIFQGTYGDGETFISMVLTITGKDIHSLKSALQHHLNPDSAEGNAVSRRFMILPQVLCITLNRTVFNKQKASVERHDKKIEYGPNLFIKPCMMETKGPEVRYSLFAVIKHSGYVATDGHYITYLKHPQQRSWHCLSDDVVETVDLSQVLLDTLKDTAYMLFYSRAYDAPSSRGGKGNKTR